MTSAPNEPGRAGDSEEPDLPATDLGIGGPAEDVGADEGSLTPPEYPDEIDPAEGSVGERGAERLGDLQNPGSR